jgi:hypothetical protein
MPVPWNQQGCDVCRGLWERGRHPPSTSVVVDEPWSFHRCSACGTQWRSSEDGVVALSAEGIYRGQPVTVSHWLDGRVRIGTADGLAAERLGLPRVDDRWWQKAVSADDPDLVHLTAGFSGTPRKTGSRPKRVVPSPFTTIDAIPGLAVRLSRRPDDGFEIAGQHLRGGDEYEYFFTIEPAHVPGFAEAIGATPGEIESAWTARVQQIAVEGEGAWLTRHRVPYRFFSYGTPIF